MAGSNGDSRYRDTMNVCQQRFRRRQPLRVGGRKINNEAHNGVISEAATANAEPANFDQACQPPRRPNQELSPVYFKLDTIIADQHRLGYLPRAPGKHQIERQSRLAGT
jgi:hypothetical protein